MSNIGPIGQTVALTSLNKVKKMGVLNKVLNKDKEPSTKSPQQRVFTGKSYVDLIIVDGQITTGHYQVFYTATVPRAAPTH